MKITTIHSLWMNSQMLYPNLMIQLLAWMMSTIKCLNTSLMMLCSVYSTFLISGISGKFRTSWCTSEIMPVPKPGKDTSDFSNYRPIALTTCICKVIHSLKRRFWLLCRRRNQRQPQVNTRSTWNFWRTWAPKLEPGSPNFSPDSWLPILSRRSRERPRL